jgi:hypothetical protein
MSLSISVKATPVITIGSVIAVIISWGLNHSILWAIVHGICSWWYIAYWFFFLQ